MVNYYQVILQLSASLCCGLNYFVFQYHTMKEETKLNGEAFWMLFLWLHIHYRSFLDCSELLDVKYDVYKLVFRFLNFPFLIFLLFSFSFFIWLFCHNYFISTWSYCHNIIRQYTSYISYITCSIDYFDFTVNFYLIVDLLCFEIAFLCSLHLFVHNSLNVFSYCIEVVCSLLLL